MEKIRSRTIKWRSTLSILVIILSFSGAFLYWGIRTYQHNLDHIIKEKEASIQALMNFAAQNVFSQYDSRIKLFLSTKPHIVEAFAQKNRKQLLQFCLPLYENALLKENPYFHEFDFYAPDNKVFLQVESPESYGEDVTFQKPIVDAANRIRKTVSGYQVGEDGIYYRVAAPVYYQDKYFGAVMFGIKVQSLVMIINKSADVDMAMLVDADKWKGAKVSIDKWDGTKIVKMKQHALGFDNCVVVKCCSNIFDELSSNFNFGPSNQRFKAEGREYNLSTKLALNDFRGIPTAKVAFAMDISDDIWELRDFVVSSVSMTIVIALLAIGILHMSFSMFMRRILQLNDSLEDYSTKLEKSNKELDKYRQDLEIMVEERTFDIERTNEELNQEILERKRTEGNLRKKEANLAKAQAIANMGHWEWNIAEDELYWSDQAFNVFGLDKKTFTPSRNSFMALVHPDDGSLVRGAINNSLYEKKPYVIDYRIILQNGQECLIHEEGELAFDEDGKPLHMLGTVQDITQVKLSNQQLLLWAKVFESSIEGIIITDKENIIQKVNRAFSDITGYFSDEVVGKSPSILKSDRHDATFFKEMKDTILQKGEWRGEIWNRRKSGEIYPQWLTVKAIKDAEGQTTNYVGIFHDMTEVKLHEEQLRYQAHHDALTGLPNRILFHDRLGVAMAHSQRVKKKLAVLFMDLDDFKRINDTLGHNIGDILLKQVGERLANCMRAHDTVARHGGDEFIIILEGLEQEEDAILAAERITNCLVVPFKHHGHALYLTASIGITFYPDDGEDEETLVRNADIAMYRAKDSGKDNYQIFTPAMNQKMTEWMAMENSIRNALDRNEFLIHYQPMVDLVSGEIVGVEALIRWQLRDGELISPKDFIPFSEDTGFIVNIGTWVLGTACKDAIEFHLSGYPIYVSVNLSPRQLQQENLSDIISLVLKETQLPAEALVFEITEGTVMDTEAEAVDVLRKLRRMGVRLAIDDFGTGYSSLYYLKQLPINKLKIDRRFIRDLAEDADDQAITTAIISMAKKLNLQVVAEGVETVEQLSFLRGCGCDQMQGFLFSKPVPKDELIQLLKENKKIDFSDFLKGKQKILPVE